MNLRQLRYFLTIARLGSLTAAGRLLNLSQPALGYQVKALEDQLGVELLRRHSRGVQMTDAGRALFESGTKALEAFAEAERSVAPYTKQAGRRFLLGVAPSPGRALLPKLLPLAGINAMMQIMVGQGMSDELIRALVQGELDGVLCYDPPDRQDIHVTPLYREDLFLVGPPSVVGGTDDPVPFDTLSHFPLVLDDRVRPIRRLIDDLAATRQTKLDLIEVEPTNVKREIIMHHGRSTIVPYGLFLDEIREGHVSARRIIDPTLERTVVFAARGDLPVSTVELLEALVQPLVARLIEEGDLRWRPV